jgi:hypothetical protein
MDGWSFDSNDWEKLATAGENAIKKWINRQMRHKWCIVVLIGSDTADRHWVNYEIEHAWTERKGVLGVYIHNLRDPSGQARIGQNPFDYVSIGERKLSEIVRTYDPPFAESKQVYGYIRRNLDSWIEEAIETRRVT